VHCGHALHHLTTSACAGYFEFLSAIKNPKHEEHVRMLEWIGGAFDRKVSI